MSDLISALSILLAGLALVTCVWLAEAAISLYERASEARRRRAALVWSARRRRYRP